MMHVTFKTPPPRVIVMQRSTPIAAANVRTMDNAPGPHVLLHCVSLVRVDGERDIPMKTQLAVHVDHIASIHGDPEK